MYNYDLRELKRIGVIWNYSPFIFHRYICKSLRKCTGSFSVWTSSYDSEYRKQASQLLEETSSNRYEDFGTKYLLIIIITLVLRI